jgi:ABC-type nitrate/sulfonate/bicarbonate transport system substrate-binding protein
LSWFHSAEFIGFYVADQLGYYANENLDVTLVAGAPEIDPVASVVEGNSQFGITSGDSIIRAQSAGQNLVAISSIFRKSPLIVMALAGSGIATPQDLTGKTVGVVSLGLDTTWDIQLIAILKKTGVDPTKIHFVPNEEFHGAADLHTGRMAASSGTFSTNELVQAKIDGEDVVSIYYGDYGVEFYNNLIFTSAQLIAGNPDLVQSFIRATMQGYQYAIEHPKEASALTIQYDENLDVAFQQATIEAQIPLIDTGDALIGWMDDDIWANTQAILLDQGYITSSMDLAKVYTNDFIK